jgi:hypothetical protein
VLAADVQDLGPGRAREQERPQLLGVAPGGDVQVQARQHAKREGVEPRLRRLAERSVRIVRDPEDAGPLVDQDRCSFDDREPASARALDALDPRSSFFERASAARATQSRGELPADRLERRHFGCHSTRNAWQNSHAMAKQATA